MNILSSLNVGRIPWRFYGVWLLPLGGLMGFAGYGAVLYTYPVFFPVIIKEFGWSAAVAATASSLARLEGGFEGPIVGYIIDRWGPRSMMLIGGSMVGLGLIVMSQTLGAGNMLMYYIIFGGVVNLGYNACLYTSSYKAVSDWWVRNRARAISIMILPTALSGIFGPTFGRYLIGEFGWRTALALVGVIMLVIFIPAALLVRPKRPEAYGLLPDGDDPKAALAAQQAKAKEGKESIEDKKAVEALLAQETKKKEIDVTTRGALTSSVFWIYSLANIGRSFAGGVIVLFAPAHLMSRGFDGASAAAFAGLMMAFTYPGRLSIAAIGDVIGPKRLMIFGCVLQGIGALAMANASVDNSIMAYGYAAFYGVGFGMTIPLTPSLRGWLFGRSSFGTIQGFANTMAMLGAVTAPTFGGYMFDLFGTYYWAYTAYGVAFLAAGFVFLFVHKAKETTVSAQPSPA